MKVGAVTGLEAEARSRAPCGACCASRAAASPRKPWRLPSACCASGAEGLVSFGIAGALAPALAPGALLLPRTVIDESGRALSGRSRLASAGRASARRRRLVRSRTGDLLGRRRCCRIGRRRRPNCFATDARHRRRSREPSRRGGRGARGTAVPRAARRRRQRRAKSCRTPPFTGLAPMASRRSAAC